MERNYAREIDDVQRSLEASCKLYFEAFDRDDATMGTVFFAMMREFIRDLENIRRDWRQATAELN